jgi:prolyl-tRNA synthetase
MRWHNLLIPTLKEDPAEAEIISHKLMIRAGLIRKLSSGIYSYLPLGLKALKKAQNIIREELDKAGAQEVLLPALQPSELWHDSGRYIELGEDMLKFTDRHNKEMVLGPTHEEVVTELVKNEVHSYKQLPLILYQIQTKFRDELRPRFGVLRSREFIMKDAYSFDRDIESLELSYKKMYDAYKRIFDRCGLKYIIVEADPGIMGGNISHEFMALADSGEDVIAKCKSCSWVSSLDRAECFEDEGIKTEKPLSLKEVDTPGVKTIEKLSSFLNAEPNRMLKTIIYESDGGFIAALVRGDLQINEFKLARGLARHSLRLATAKEIEDLTGAPLGFSGPVGLKNVEFVGDSSVRGLSNFICGANKADKHLLNVNMPRDFKVDKFLDIRFIAEDDRCPDCKSGIEFKHSIELGHVFKLGTKYSEKLSAVYLDADGKIKPIIMGCYGIGVNRIIAAMIEQNNDKDGIIWTKELSPVSVSIIVIGPKDDLSLKFASELDDKLESIGVSSLFDDRPVSAGIKFKDADLIGAPVRITVSEDNLKKGKVEVKERKEKASRLVPKDELISLFS